MTRKKRAKTWKQLLLKAQRRHLTEMGITSLAQFKRTRELQEAQELQSEKAGFWNVPCWDCKDIERRLVEKGRMESTPRPE